MRIKFLGMGWLMMILAGCSSHNAAYYQMHPKEVFTALEACQAGTFKAAVSCQELESIAQTYRPWIHEIQRDPQLFGQQIMQNQIHCRLESLGSAEKQTCQQELEKRLAVVKWLESPES